MILWCALGWAGELEVERARADLDRQGFEAAMTAVRADAQAGDWQALEVYHLASIGAGREQTARRELRALGGSGRQLVSELDPETELGGLLEARATLEDEPGQALELVADCAWPACATLRIEAHVRLGDRGSALKVAREVLKDDPLHPEVLAGLWTPNQDLGLQRKRLKVLKKAVDTDTPSVLYDLRLRRVTRVAAEDLGRVVEERLVAAGEPERPLWAPLDRPARARWVEWIRRGESIPVLAHGDRLAVFEELGRLDLVDGRPELAVDRWVEERGRADHPVAAAGHAWALLAADRHEEAIAAATDSLRLNALPVFDDRTWARTRRLQRRAAAALDVRSQARNALGQHAAALRDRTLATILLGDEVTSQQVEASRRLEKLVRALDPGRRYRGRLAAREAALRLAERGLEDGDHQGALDAATDAATLISLAASRHPRGFGPVLGDALALRARARLGLQARADALSDLALAALLAPGYPHPDDIGLRARLLEDSGEFRASFRAWAQAASLEAPGAREALERTWAGLGPWQVGAADAVSRLMDERSMSGPVDEVRVRRVATPIYMGEGTPPVVGANFPSWGVKGPKGALSAATTRGRVVVMAFWASWCGPCRVELPAIADLARSMKQDGVPVEVVAVSLDETADEYQAFLRQHDLEGVAMARSPDLGESLGIRSLPSTWVIDTQGVARHHHAGYGKDVTSALDRQVRTLAR